MDDFNSRPRERARTAQAGGVKTLSHIRANFGKAQRTQQASARDALLKRLEFRTLKNREQFRLSAENDLKKFFLIRVSVPKQSNFFEKLDTHEVRFVDEQNRRAALLLRLKKHLVKRGQATWLARSSARNFVFLEYGLEQLRRSKGRIDEKRGNQTAAALGFFRKNLQSGVQQRGLARANGPSDYRETFALQNALKQNFERGAVWVSQMKESGVRGETERFFFELIKGRVQIDLPRVPNSYRNCKTS